MTSLLCAQTQRLLAWDFDRVLSSRSYSINTSGGLFGGALSKDIKALGFIIRGIRFFTSWR